METKKAIVSEKSRNLEPEIFKQNNLIECSFKELDTWSEIHHDLFNELIAIYQHYEHKEGLFEELNRRIYVRRNTLEKNTNIRRKNNKEIFEFLKKMRDTSFTIKGIYQSNGYKTTAVISFFNSVYLHEKQGKESYFEIEYTELFAMLCNKSYSLKYGNYSKLNLLNTTSLRSKYAKALYELIELYKYKGQVTISEEKLKTLLKYDVKNYRFSYLLREINKVYEAVENVIPFSYIIHKEEKSITFTIENKK